ncbi:hypothetical protein [Coleofasciculus sp. FACHB-1120]|uniref:hypothetical protein n=1 Tax=Coleofasciculus sp. FACHB-1120 TaxID=2692783 RepID=UPI001685BF0A|nr:hypothetical protein [Coleofasciculus sp. FACHB-1120]MBD2744947.1 hypothetical protein [Coleofasciculus sp. FACHB-1120]
MRSQAQFSQTAKIRSVTLQGAECGCTAARIEAINTLVQAATAVPTKHSPPVIPT